MRTTIGVIAIVGTVSFVIGAAVWASGPVHAQPREKSSTVTREVRVISALNDCIQQRFKDVNEGFGMARVLKPGNTAHRFRPETVREVSAVRDLEQAHLQVVFYLVRRAVLRPMPGPGYWDQQRGRGIIKGPVEITTFRSLDSSNDAPPRPRDLWDDSQRAMRLFGASESHEFVNSGWKFVARPVRASAEICLRCHRTGGEGTALELGDAIGAAIYGYRPVRP